MVEVLKVVEESEVRQVVVAVLVEVMVVEPQERQTQEEVVEVERKALPKLVRQEAVV